MSQVSRVAQHAPGWRSAAAAARGPAATQGRLQARPRRQQRLPRRLWQKGEFDSQPEGVQDDVFTPLICLEVMSG